MVTLRLATNTRGEDLAVPISSSGLNEPKASLVHALRHRNIPETRSLFRCHLDT
jgi:hypothetical protein